MYTLRPQPFSLLSRLLDALRQLAEAAAWPREGVQRHAAVLDGAALCGALGSIPHTPPVFKINDGAKRGDWQTGPCGYPHTSFDKGGFSCYNRATRTEWQRAAPILRRGGHSLARTGARRP